LNLPRAEKFEFKGNHGQENGRSTQIAAEWLNEVFLKNRQILDIFVLMKRSRIK
jgi:hypothetical protein